MNLRRIISYRFCHTYLLAALVLSAGAASSKAAQRLIPNEQAARLGLERAWFAQVPVDSARSRVSQWMLYYDRLYAVTTSGVVAAFNADTGEMLWSKQVGKPGYPAFGPGANADFLGVVSGSKLYLLNRHDGRLEWVRQLGSAPSSGPALSDEYAFVALVTGRIEGYKLDDPTVQPWYYQSKGRTFLRPTTTGKIVTWPTTAGYLYASRANDPGVLYRLETNADIITSPAAMPPYLYIASQDGYLYCLDENTGDEAWRYSTGYAIDSSPAIVGDQAFVASSEPALHALDAKTGAEQWISPGVSHFAARGKERVYASDRYGNLLVLDAKTGNPVGRLSVGEGVSTLVNDQTDRILFVTDGGLVQCLHEIGANTATTHRKPDAPKVDAPPPAPGTAPAPAEADAPVARDAGDEGSPFEEEGGEDAAPADVPADAPVEEDNPFGF